MLVNKEKTTKKKQKKSTDNSEENLQSMKSWVRKIEQTTNSVSSRLSAVEKRISARKADSSDDSSTLDANRLDRRLSKVFTGLKEGDTNSKEIVEVSQILDDEFERIQDELISQQIEVESIKENVGNINKSIVEIKNEIKKTREVETKFLTNFRSRLEIIEKRAPPVMKLGNMEVPIEISGVIAGFIAIFAALFVYLNQTSLLVSPAFLGLVGCVFIGSALFKAAKSER